MAGKRLLLDSSEVLPWCSLFRASTCSGCSHPSPLDHTLIQQVSPLFGSFCWQPPLPRTHPHFALVSDGWVAWERVADDRGIEDDEEGGVADPKVFGVVQKPVSRAGKSCEQRQARHWLK